MPEIDVRPVATWRDKRAFVDLAWDLYKHDPLWVPPLRGNQRELLGYKRHPFHDYGEVQTFLAWKNGRACGRIAAIVNREHNRTYREERGFFGFFECIDDGAVARALLDAARQWLLSRGMHGMRGPVNPSMNYECGLLVEGFDSAPTFMMTYNPPYYAELLEAYGLRKAHDLLAFIGHKDRLPELDKRIGPLAEAARERCDAVVRPLDKKHFMRDVELFLELYNRACEGMWGFVPLPKPEIAVLAGSLRHLLIPELALIGEVQGKAVGAVIGMPDYNPRIKEINGRLFPFGFLTLLDKRRTIERIRIWSIAVVPEYQQWGLGLLLMRSLVPKALAIGVQDAEFSWVSEANTMATQGLRKAGTRPYKTYRIYDLDDSVATAP